MCHGYYTYLNLSTVVVFQSLQKFSFTIYYTQIINSILPVFVITQCVVYCRLSYEVKGEIFDAHLLLVTQ